MLEDVHNRHCLLLQGPMGPFFRKLDKALRKQGARVFRICFNGGDFFYAHKHNSTCFTGKPDQWAGYLARFLKRNRIDTIFLYGDCRFYHQQAIEIADPCGIDVFVFEEGYVRPNYITLERGGVNARSTMPKEAAGYREMVLRQPVRSRGSTVKHALQKWTVYTIVYYLCMRLFAWHFPNYRHHRSDALLQETAFGLRNGWRKIGHRIAERGLEERIKTKWSGTYFFVPLQTIGDTQISCHSPFADMRDFIDVVLRSFSRHAPEAVFLVIKHHPLDRGRVNYTRYIHRRARQLHVFGRVVSLHDVHLPTCLENAIGTITVNSTVGISSLVHGTPTLVLGRAVYDIEGLTCKGMPLDRFWTQYQPPDKVLFQKFRGCLVKRTQLVGSFYSGFPEKLNRLP